MLCIGLVDVARISMRKCVYLGIASCLLCDLSCAQSFRDILLWYHLLCIPVSYVTMGQRMFLRGFSNPNFI